MQIQLPPELEAQIRQDVERGPFASVDEFVEYAVALLHEQETWLVQNREAIETGIQAAWDAAERGELANEASVRQRMEERKTAWAHQQRPA